MIELISAGIGIIGVVIGWGLNELTTTFRERPKLCFRMVSTPDDELIDKEYRVKESLSEHGIEIFNVGEKPFVLENFVICYKKKLLVDCHMPESDRIILPFYNVVYTLSEQEANTLEWYCQKEHFEECQVTAYSVDQKKAKGILSVPLFDFLHTKKLSQNCVDICQNDWNAYEISWDFQHHPLLRKVPTIAEAFDQWQAECDKRFHQLKANLDENLKFIADALGGKGQPKDVIRNYFLNDFYSDHCKIYQKRPIYWLFDSGKKNGFKALIYMHRYQSDTIARIRTDYVHEQQARYRTAIADLEQRIANASTGERVKLNKKLTTLQAQDAEIRTYEEKIHHLADQMISIDLDNGVKKNYAIFQDVLAKIK